jgi:galactokinase
MNFGQQNVAPPSLDALTAIVESDFLEQFGRSPSLVVAAPGRVNLIGEHIDYNDGFVLPLAIERYLVMAAAPSTQDSAGSSIRIRSLDLDESESIVTDQTFQPGRTGWIRYVQGVIAGFIELGTAVSAFDAVIGSTIPIGAGLSSSAALEVATATTLEQLNGQVLDLETKALLCQRAEHQFVGVPCGIMDQFSTVFGKLDELMLIDCQTLQVDSIPFDSREVSVLIANSDVKHALIGGEYAQRRGQCDSALSKLGHASWRDVRIEELEQRRGALTDVEFRRGRHVVTEIERTRAAVLAIRNRDWETTGRLMYASHQSLRDDYEVSCPELDLLVEIASSMGTRKGVFGSRMTGGGFGGCTVSLIDTNQLESVIAELARQYESATGTRPLCFASRPASGVQVIKGRNGAAKVPS